MSPLITIRKMLAILMLAAITVAAASSLVPPTSQTFKQQHQPQPFFILAAIAFALTPVLVKRNEYATTRSMASLLFANSLIAASLITGWQFVYSGLYSGLQCPKTESVVLYLLLLIGYVVFWKYAAKNDPKFRRFMELSIPGALASFCFLGWLLPWLNICDRKTISVKAGSHLLPYTPLSQQQLSTSSCCIVTRNLRQRVSLVLNRIAETMPTNKDS